MNPVERRVPSTAKRLVAIALAVAVVFQTGPATPPVVQAVEPADPEGATDPTTVPAEPDWATPAFPTPISIGHDGGGLEQDVALGPVATRDVPGRSDPPDERTEVADERTEHTRTYAEPDGSFTHQVARHRLNYRDDAGDWQPIDLTLVPAEDGPYQLEVAALDRDVRFGTDAGDTALAEIAYGSHRLGLRAIGFGAGERLEDNRVEFAADDGGATLTGWPIDRGVRYEITVLDPAAPGTYHLAIDAGDLVVERTSYRNGLAFVDPDGDFSEGRPAPLTVGVLSPPYLVNGTRLEGDPVTVIVTDPRGVDGEPDPDVPDDVLDQLADGEVLVTYRIDPDWLAAPEREFPVVLDPNACIGPGATGCTINNTSNNSFDEFVFSANPNQHDDPQNPWGVTRVGFDSRTDDGGSYGTMRSLFYFPSIELPDGASVTSASVRLTVDQVHGGWADEQLRFYRMKGTWGSFQTSWNDVHSPDQFEDPDTATAGLTGLTGGSQINVSATNAVRDWYTRRGADWKPNLGLLLRMVNEGSTYGEVDFKRSFTPTPANAPLLTINYVEPVVDIGFDPALGAQYAPASMVAGQTTILPLRISNRSGFAYNHTNDGFGWRYRIGYRWFDADGDLLACPAANCVFDLGATINNGTTYAQAMTVTAPASTGHYTLRLDLVRNHSSGVLWASDWAKPSLYYARVRDALSPDSARWAGASKIERAEFGIAVVAGGGTAVGDLRSVPLGDGGSLGINLATRNLAFTGAGGIGFDDLTPLGLTYGYNRADIGDCITIIHACGWYTNFDERFIAGSDAGSYVYRDPGGTRHLVATDANGQLTSSAGVLLARPRITYFDERDFDVNASVEAVTGASQSLTAYSGSNVLRQNSNATIDYGTVPTVDLSHYRWVSFAVRTTNSTGVGVGFKIRNLSNPTAYPDAWFAYVMGSSFSTGVAQVDVSGTVVNTWNALDANDGTTHDLYAAAITAGLGAAGDRLQVVGFKTYRKSAGETGYTYIDAVRFEGRPGTVIADSAPSWSAGGGNASTYAADKLVGTHSIKVLPVSYGASPMCQASDSCHSTRNMVTNPFASWAWKKVGGSTVAVVFALRDTQLNNTGSITYYAGPVPPSGAPNPIQVSPTLPTEWTHVTRNVLEDARQVLNFYTDQPGGTDPESFPAGPQPNPVDWYAYRLVAADGVFGLFDAFDVQTLPDIGLDQLWRPTSAGDSTFTYDFVATYPAGERHYFNPDGFLERIVDGHGNITDLDWTVTLTSYDARAWELAAIRAATDATAGPSVTYQRQIDLVVTFPTNRRKTSFVERLGTTGSSTGRSTDFFVATIQEAGHNSGDLRHISPGRDSDGACGTRPNGCVEIFYNNNISRSISAVADPRWDGTTSGADDLRAGVSYADGWPIAITDRSRSFARLLTVLSYDVGASDVRRALVADAAAMATNRASYVDLSPDGRPALEYVPLACDGTCTSGSSGTYPDDPDTVDRLRRLEFNGLAEVNAVTTFRVSGGSPQIVTTREARNAGARVDNYADPLAAAQLAWSQTADQHFASLRDSGGFNPDLYRTEYAYDGDHNQIGQRTPVHNRDPEYAGAIGGTSLLTAYWRLADSGGSAADASGNGNTGSYGGGVTQQVTGGLIRDTNTAVTFNGSTGRVTASVSLPQSAYTIEAWVRENSDYSNDATARGIAGRWSSNSGAALYLQSGRLYFAHGSSSIDTGIPLLRDRWYHVAATWDGTHARVYVDSRQVGYLNVASAPGAGGSVFEIGRYDGNYNGATLDEVALYSGALAPSRIRAHVQAGRGVMEHRSQTRYDINHRPLERHDSFVANGGFESGLTEWQAGGGATTLHWDSAHANIRSGHGALEITGAAFANQDAQLVPGQTARLQLAAKTDGGGSTHASYTLAYWRVSTSSWQTIVTGSHATNQWTVLAWDVTVPYDADGRLRLTLWNDVATGTAYFDDVLLVSAWSKTEWASNGLPTDIYTPQPGSSSGVPYQQRFTYTATATHPAIFPETIVANYEDNAFNPAIPDQDVTSFATYDAWGRVLTATDPDGVTSTTTYVSSGNGVQTDVASVADGLGQTTTFTYDGVGNRLTTTSPSGLTSSASFDLFSRTEAETAPDGVVTDHTYDTYGRRTSTIANATAAGGAPAVTTAFSYDEFGRVTRADADDGQIDQVTQTAYDLLGNVTEQRVYTGAGTGGTERKTTYHFETQNVGTLYTRATPTGTRLPSQPSAAPAPVCPGASSPVRCNSVAALDMNGRVVTTTDAYGIVDLTDRDAAGNPVRRVANWVDGAGPTADRNVVTATRYDIHGRPWIVTDPAGRETVTTYDALGRPVRMLARAGAGSANDYASIETVVTAAGRVERVSHPAAHDATAANRTWTRTEYDAAGRAVRTLEHYDIDGNAHYLLDGLETGSDGWSGASLSGFLGAAAAINLDTAYHAVGPATGAGRLRVTTSAGSANTGARRDLSGQTFISGHTYRLQASVLAPNSTGLRAMLGVSGGSPASATLTANGSWQTISVDWTPSSTTSVNVYGAIRKDAAGSVDVYIDDLQVWDITDAEWNIPTETAYDADGRITASLLPPGAPGEAPMATTTAHDPVGRPVAVSANARHTYAARIATGATAESLVAYYPLDAASGASLTTALGSGPSLTRGGGTRLGVAGAVDDARTAMAVDAGWAAGGSAASTATNNFSLEAWFRLDAATANQTIAYNGTDAGGWGLGLDGSGQLAAVYGGVATLSTNQKPSLGAWHHAVLVRSGGTTTIYLDGTAYTPSSSGSTPLTPGAGFSVGRQSAATPRHLDGAVDEVAVYGTGLSAGVVSQHYAAGREPAVDARLTTRTDYDGLGRAVTSTNPRGIVTAAEYDRLGRRTATIANWRDGSPASASSDDDVRSTFAVNTLGELIGYCPAVQVFVGGCDPSQSNETQAWRFTYDVLGNRATQVPPVNATLTALDTRAWTYDAGGRLTVVTDRTSGGTTSRHTDYTYDDVGRVLTERTYLGGGTGNLELEFTTTWNADGTRASRAFDGTAASPAQGTDTLTFTYDAMGRPDQVKRSSTVLTDYGWNADDTLASRLDDGVGTTAFSYDWADRQTGVTAPALFGSGSVSQTYRLDGTLASRATPNSVTAALTYDAAKRPVGISFGSHSLSRGYDRAGNVTADGRSFSGVSGDAGTGSATYSYDGLDRVSAASGLSRTDSYTYDRNGNRLTAVEGATTVTYTYDRADQAIKQTISGVDTNFAYNAWGDLTSAADRDNGVTAHAYDAGGRMVSLTPPSASTAAFSYDALGRPASRTIGAASLTYAYVGVTPVSYATVPSAGSATYGLLDAGLSRVGLHTGGTTAWSTFDLHGNLVGATASGSGTIVSALRYDAYGATLDSYTAGAGATATPWRYQGRLDLSPDADEPLYDYGARRYRPSAGAFTQLDTYPGSAADPRSMNRFLYAHANPTTLIDPTGHCSSCLIDGYVTIPTAGPNHAVQMAAAQQQIAAASSWAPASATNTANTAARMAQQAQANANQAGELERFRNFTVQVPSNVPPPGSIEPWAVPLTRAGSIGVSLVGASADEAGKAFASDAARRLAIWQARTAWLSGTRFVGSMLAAGADIFGNAAAGLQREVGNAIAKAGRIVGWGGAALGGLGAGLGQWEHDSARDPTMPDALKGVRATVVGAASTLAAGLGAGAVGGLCVGTGWCAPFVVPVTAAAGFVIGEVAGSLAGFGFDILDVGVSFVSSIRMPWDNP